MKTISVGFSILMACIFQPGLVNAAEPVDLRAIGSDARPTQQDRATDRRFILRFSAFGVRTVVPSEQSKTVHVAPGSRIQGSIEFEHQAESSPSFERKRRGEINGMTSPYSFLLHQTAYTVRLGDPLNLTFKGSAFIVTDGMLVLGLDPFGRKSGYGEILSNVGAGVDKLGMTMQDSKSTTDQCHPVSVGFAQKGHADDKLGLIQRLNQVISARKQNQPRLNIKLTCPSAKTVATANISFSVADISLTDTDQ